MRQYHFASLIHIIHSPIQLQTQLSNTGAFAEHSEGHFRLDFWRELQLFKKTRSGTQDFATSVRDIYEKYVVPRSVLPVLPNEMRGDINDALDIDSGVKVTRHVFDDAENLILASIVRFCFIFVVVVVVLLTHTHRPSIHSPILPRPRKEVNS